MRLIKKKYVSPEITIQEYEVIVDLLTPSNNDRPDENVPGNPGENAGEDGDHNITDARKRYGSGYSSSRGRGFGNLW